VQENENPTGKTQDVLHSCHTQLLYRFAKPEEKMGSDASLTGYRTMDKPTSTTESAMVKKAATEPKILPEESS